MGARGSYPRSKVLAFKRERPDSQFATTSFISASFGKVTAANDARIVQLGRKPYF
jgi:hypothetical protein